MRAKELAFLRTLPSESNFDKVRVTQNECNVYKSEYFLQKTAVKRVQSKHVSVSCVPS